MIEARSSPLPTAAKSTSAIFAGAAAAAAKLKRLYAAIEDGLAEAKADRAVMAAERLGPIINPEILVRFAAATCEMLRNKDGTLRPDLLRAVAQRIEITSPTSADMIGSRIELLRTLAANGGVESAALDVRSFVPKWRARWIRVRTTLSRFRSESRAAME